MRATRTAIIILGIAVGGLLTGCSGADTPAASPTTVTSTTTRTQFTVATVPTTIGVATVTATVTAPPVTKTLSTATVPATTLTVTHGPSTGYSSSDPGAFATCLADSTALSNAGDYEGALRKSAECARLVG